ncbi:efflux RND transporter periplasmic adaptor subunit [Robiginitalea sediminis]|uniref:efflux RND transporter periplasmic adaptor subunit n=1 Tax=Robiginitalea sediminis TaxID=1982593 RepID=UPI000B4BA320|nr:HlyD family efflux transporter periplasmic adaptor subunit [Robiginitalea sediminis]
MAVVSALSAALLSGCRGGEAGIAPEILDVTEAVYASVTIVPDSMYRVHAAVSGILEANLVEEGRQVVPGDPLLQINGHATDLYRENARLQMELAASNLQGEASPLNDLAARIRVAELTYRDDSTNYDRQTKLWARQIGSLAELERRQLAFERSASTLRELQSEYHRLQRELRTQLEQARNTYQASSSDAEEFRIRSTIYGKVYALYKEPGEAVLPNEPLAMLGSAETFLAEMLVDEVDIVRLKTGQQVLITLDAYADRLFEGKVSKIYPEKDTRNQTFLVEARFTTPPEVLYPGLSGEANIVIATRQDALTIPRSYLVGADSVRTTAGMVKVETGLITLDRVEIRSGLQPGTRLLKPEE